MAILNEQLLAAAKCRAADGSTSAAGFWKKGELVSVVDNGVGDHTWTVGPGISALEDIIQITPVSASTIARAVPLSATTFQVLQISDAGAAADADYNIMIWKVPQ